jgi:predicted RNA methylase
MDFYADVTKSNIDDYLYEYEVILCKIRSSRVKAKQIAVLEMILLEFDNEVLFIKNGPLGDIKGIISFLCPRKNLISFKEKLVFSGYCNAFYLLDFENFTNKKIAGLNSDNPMIWKGRKFSVAVFFNQDNKIYSEQSTNNREFKIIDSNNEIKTIQGYRGDGSDLGKRALPVEDARCMVNLSQPWKNKKMIDPFAGAGGIIYQFKYVVPDGIMTSIDIDPVLRPGLEFYGAAHYVMSAADASFPENSFDSVITEVPFSDNAAADIVKALKNIDACLSKNGVYVIMCQEDQAEFIRETMEELGNFQLFGHEIDRKGTDVEIQIWHKNSTLPVKMRDFISVLKDIY